MVFLQLYNCGAIPILLLRLAFLSYDNMYMKDMLILIQIFYTYQKIENILIDYN